MDRIDFASVVGAVGRGWCHEKNVKKIMDVDLALAIAEEVQLVITQHFGPQVWDAVETHSPAANLIAEGLDRYWEQQERGNEV